MSIDCQAAWVPFDQVNGQVPSVLKLAVTWTEKECARQRKIGLLITPRKNIGLYPQPIQGFAARHDWITRLGGMRTRPAGARPVLLFAPAFDDLAYAAGLARGSSLCVTEWPDVPLTGWASACRALNLVNRETTPEPAAGTMSLLEQLHFAGNNGWFDAPGKRDALRLLAELRAMAPQADSQFIASYMLGMGGVSANAAKHLLKLAAE